LQQWLELKGFDPGPIDGADGPKTSAAWSAYIGQAATGASNTTQHHPGGVQVPSTARFDRLQIALSWDNGHRQAWSAQLIASIRESMSQLEQGNPDSFVSGYSSLSAELRIKFWAELLIAVAKFESDWNPNEIFHEPPPLSVDSIGLLQLSYQDHAHYNLEPLSPAAKSLQDPLVNLRCGVKIFATLVSRDKTIASGNHGAAAYWSTLRPGHKHHLEEIKTRIKRNVPV
jgi:soluble lytic murein transglycosylase-like protein